MSGLMQTIFGLVCGQNPAHTWAPGGVALPLCQRCTGLYAGAALAFSLLILCRPRVDVRYRRLHCFLVLAMTPFGFHLIPHGEILRTMSGHWFGFGVVGLLWLIPGEIIECNNSSQSVFRSYYLIGLMSLFIVPILALRGGAIAAATLSCLALAGLAAIVGLILANIILIMHRGNGWIRRRTGALAP